MKKTKKETVYHKILSTENPDTRTKRYKTLQQAQTWRGGHKIGAQQAGAGSNLD